MEALKVICLIMILSGSTNNIKFDPKAEPTGVMFSELARTYISYTRWQICYYYDLTEYFDKIEQFKICIKQMHVTCNRIQDNGTCTIILDQFDNHLESIQTDAETIESFESGSHRAKRAPFEFIGKIENLLFGLMDAETAKLYDEKINELQADASRTNDLMKQQTMLIKGVVQLNNRTFSDLKKNVEVLDQEIVTLSSKLDLAINEMILNNKFRDVAQIATLITLEHTEISKELMTLLQNSIDGKISGIIPFKSLKNCLQIISNKLDHTQKLPIDIKNESIYHIYKIISVRSTLINKRIMIEISIPILEKNQFHLFKAIPIPTLFNDYFIILEPTSKYFLLNTDRLEYLPLDEDELSNCRHTVDNQLICIPYSPIKYNREQICELNILPIANLNKIFEKCNFKVVPRTNYIIQINHQDKYYCIIDKQYMIMSECKNREPETKILNTSGILEVEQNCMITTNDVKIRSHNVKYFNDTQLLIPEYTLPKTSVIKLKNIKVPEKYVSNANASLILIQDYTNDFAMLSKQIEEEVIQENIKKTFEEIHYDKQKHAYAISIMTVITIVIVVLAAYMIICKFKPIWTFLGMLTSTSSGTHDNQRVPGAININLGHLTESNAEQ